MSPNVPQVPRSLTWSGDVGPVSPPQTKTATARGVQHGAPGTDEGHVGGGLALPLSGVRKGSRDSDRMDHVTYRWKK